MAEDRILRKLKKLASRINAKIEAVRDEMEDLEIEFELLQQHINKFEPAVKKTTAKEEEITVILDEGEQDLDLENTSAVSVPKKF